MSDVCDSCVAPLTCGRIGRCSEYDAPLEVRVTDPTTGGEKGAKAERISLLPLDVLLRDVSPHYVKGAEKYAPHNWRKGYAWSLSADALGRHFAAWLSGEDNDPEFGTPHLAAVVFHALALLHFAREFPEKDDVRSGLPTSPGA